MSRLLLVFVLTFSLTACVPALMRPQAAPSQATPSVPLSQGKWTVKLTQSGGIMGLQRNITVTSDGKIVAVDERTNQTVTSKLTQEELGRLKVRLDSSAFTTAAPQTAVCADCFLYDLEVQSGGQTYSAHYDDTNLPDSSLEPLIAFLRDLLDRSFPLR